MGERNGVPGKVVVFPNAGHFPHLVAPDRFADEVRAIARKAV